MTNTQNIHPKKDFFVSYSSLDKEWAEWIAYQLEENGYTTVIQAWDWGAGNNFIWEMQNAARTCERTIIVLSPAFLGAIYTQPEWTQAFRRDPTGEKRLLIPIRVSECELEGFFGPLVYIDFLKEKPPEVSDLRNHLIKELLDGVKVDRKKPTTEPPVPSLRRITPFVAKSETRSQPSERDSSESISKIGSPNEIFGEGRKEVLLGLEKEWLRSRRVVALLQGFPGTGKTRLASSVSFPGWVTLDPVQVGIDSDDRETDLLMDLATSLDIKGFGDLAQELEKGEASNILAALRRLIRRERVVVIIDEFQRLFSNTTACPPEDWREFIESLNNAAGSEGKLLLISNRATPQDRWSEGCVVKNLKKLNDSEGSDFLRECLIERDLLNRIPNNRMVEIAGRLGGNPRAIKTLVGSLFHFSIDELVSAMPERNALGDVTIDHHLLEQFERGLISRAMDRLGEKELQFMRWVAVNRYLIATGFYSYIETRFPDWKPLRSVLIDRFLLEATSAGDALHPLAREIAVTRLREEGQEWQSAHSQAANYQLELFESSTKRFDMTTAASFANLRHHLFESGRLNELSRVSARMKSFVLSRIAKPTHSKVPRSTEILEEHIVLIESLPEAERTKGLEYHLALCLRERNGTNDYENALTHAKKAIGPGVYYAVWLLLADLEFTLNGSEALKRTAARALDSLGAGSNAFAIYHHCANLLDKDGRTGEAIEFLERGIKTPGVQCKSSLISMCVRFLDQIGDKQRASELLAYGLEDGGIKEEGIVFAKWASRLSSEGQHEEAILLLDRAIARKEITKLFSLYLIKSRAQIALGRIDCAIRTLREGISDKRVIDPVLLFRQLAEMLARQGNIDEAVELLQSAVSHRAIRDIAPLFHATAGILETAGDFDLGARLLERALGHPKLQNDHNMYLACAKMHFRARDLELALKILKRGLARPQLRERNQLIIKVAEITHRMGQTKDAIGILGDAIENESSHRHLGKIYHYCSELLEAQDDVLGAEKVLRKGIEAPAIADKTVLFQALAKNLAKQNRTDEAVNLLREAVKLPGIPGSVIIYQSCASILAKNGRVKEAIDFLKEGMEVIGLGNKGALLMQCAELLSVGGRVSEAIDLLKSGVVDFPKDQGIKNLLKKMDGRRRK